MTGRKMSLALIFALSAFVLVKAEKIETENSIGLEQPALLENRAPVFNGDFKLGTAGFAVKQALDTSICFDPKVKNELQTEAREDGSGKCLKINSIDGSPYFNLIGREVYIPKPMKLKFTFDAKLREVPGADKTLTLRVDFRHTNPGRIRDSKKKYSISGGAFKLNEKWRKCTVNVKAAKAGYYRFCFFTELSPRNSIPTVLIDSIAIKSDDGSFGAELFPQAAIYTDKAIPAYDKGSEVKYTVKAILPGQTGDSAEIDLVFYNEQTKEVAFSKKVALKRSAENVFEGQASIMPPEYGAFAPLAKYNGKTIDSFGGETQILHPVSKHAGNDLASRLAVNFHTIAEGRRGQPESDKRNFWNSSSIHSEKIEDQFEIMKKGGIKAVNFIFKWKDLEPEEGKWDFSSYDKTVELCRKNGLKIMVILGAHLSWHRRTGKPAGLPAWIVKYSGKHKVTPFHPSEGILPPVDRWSEYCKKIAVRYRDMIVDMEVLGEPKAWCTPEEYMIYLKASKEAIHSVAPEIPVIGVCPTGDGDSPRFMEWSEAVLKEGAEKYLDGFSYHPYGASNDFQTGDYFEATTTINKVKSLLKNPKTGMWNTECFQLPNSKYKRCDRWDASTALRHYLICLGNDIKMVAPYDLYLLRKDRLNPHVRIITPWTYEKIPAPANAAANFLSFILKDTAIPEVLNVNNFSRTYMFSNKSGSYAVGAIWYLRPEGCSWTRPEKYKNIKIYDMFGNPVSSSSLEMKLGYDPLYITGSKKEVENCINNSSFIPSGDIVEIRGRFFENDLYLDAKNLLGKSEKISVRLDKKEGFVFPEYCNFIFEKNINNSVMLQNICSGNGFDLKELSYKTLIGGKSFSDGKVSFLPKTKSYSFPEKGAPLSMQLKNGAQILMAATKEGLEISISSEDKEIVAPEKNLWTGDSVEIFIDTLPMEKLDQESNGIIQYVFSVKPSLKHGETFWANRKVSVKPSSSVKITESGYAMKILIPWKEILPDEGPFPLDVIGIDMYVNNFSAGGKNKAQILSNLPGRSCRQRFHYPLFKLPAPIKSSLIEDCFALYGISCVKNAEFTIEKGNKGRPKYWYLTEAEYCKYGDFGQGGKKGIRILRPVGFKKKLPVAVGQEVKCLGLKGKKLMIEALIKLDVFKGKDPNALGFLIFFYDENKKNIGGSGYGQRVKHGEAFDWSIFQISKRIPEKASSFTVTFCLPNGFSNGALYVDHVRMKIAE